MDLVESWETEVFKWPVKDDPPEIVILTPEEINDEDADKPEVTMSGRATGEIFFEFFCVCNIFNITTPFIAGTSVLSDFHTDSNVLAHSIWHEQLAACQEKLREVSHRLKDANLKLLGKLDSFIAMIQLYFIAYFKE